MSKKILLADDSLTIQKVVELTFSDSDYDLICVGNGLRALEKVREDRPDLILADVVMPEKNGYEVCEAIKADPATARIPIILLTGTFEPFDRQRAERIGADAIVSKPFDSQQLLRQVEALLTKTPVVSPEVSAAATMALRIPQEIALSSGAPSARAPERATEEAEPFDAGFSPEDFTGSIRLPTGDPFEEEYGRADVDSAIEAFGRAEQPARAPEAGAPFEVVEEMEESSWLTEEPERHPAPEGSPWIASSPPAAPPLFFSGGETAPEPAPSVPEPSLEHAAEVAVPPAATAPPVQEISADAARELFEVSRAAPPAPEKPREERPAQGATPHELEALAQTSSIPELAKMLSSVSRPADLSDADIDRLAARIVEKLSDRIIREIAWEVIPDMAEIVIKQRIKELEAGIE